MKQEQDEHDTKYLHFLRTFAVQYRNGEGYEGYWFYLKGFGTENYDMTCNTTCDTRCFGMTTRGFI